MTQYGHFNEPGQFVIENPFTPEPWLHYLIRPGQPGTETFCSGVTTTGGGFDVRGTHENTFLDTQIHLNDADDAGRYVYIVDQESGACFTTTWQPVRPPQQSYRVTLDFGRITFESECAGIQSEVVMFVPRHFDGWIQDITLHNLSGHTRRLALYPFVPIHMGNALERLLAGDNAAFFGGARFDPDLKAIVFRCHGGTAVKDDPEKINGLLGNVAAFFSSLNTAGTPYETSLERLLGDRFHSLANPRSILEGQLSSRDHPSLRRTCGVFKNEIALEPGQSVRFAVALAAGSTQGYYLNGKQQLRGILSGLSDAAARTRMLEQVSAWWREQLGRLTIQSPEKKLDNAFRWLQYQCQVVYVLNRMKSRFHTGYEYGWGFRDILQDVLYKLPYEPAEVASALRHISAQIFSDGVAYHNFFIDQPGNKQIQASDDPLWFPAAVISYCRETADFAFLDEVTDYAEVHESQAGVRGSLLEHCQRALERAWLDRSPRGLPYLKDCDWNDDLNTERRDGKPNDWMESVMVAQQLHRLLLDMAGLLRACGRDLELAADYEHRAAQLKEAIQAHALDDQGYYKRVLSLDPQVEELGSSLSQFGRIFLETQVFAILGGVADPARAELVLQAVEQNLDGEFGARLCFPPFTDLAQQNILPQRSWGIEKEPPAVKENGSIFMHLNAWLVQAYAMRGHGRKVLAHYLKCLPENLSADQERYRAEPFVYPEFVHGREAEDFGRGGHTWLTGTAPTMHTALLEYIFGLKPEYGGMRIDPCVDPAWTNFSIERSFRGATYRIHFKNPDGVEHGIKHMTLDGNLIQGNLLPVLSDGQTHEVEVLMGS
jgi:cellobiose phosphorylase